MDKLETKELQLQERLAKLEAMEADIKAREKKLKESEKKKNRYFCESPLHCGTNWQPGQKMTFVLSTDRSNIFWLKA